MNDELATRCSVCDGDLVLDAIRRERDSAHVLLEYETHLDIQDSVHAWYHRRRWRRIGRWLLVASLPFALWGGWSIVRYQTSGKLPSVEQVERELKVWALPERPAVLRGRPLTEVPFTYDASRGIDDDPIFSLYLDDHERTVAFAAQLWVPSDSGREAYD